VTLAFFGAGQVLVIAPAPGDRTAV